MQHVRKEKGSASDSNRNTFSHDRLKFSGQKNTVQAKNRWTYIAHHETNCGGNSKREIVNSLFFSLRGNILFFIFSQFLKLISLPSLWIPESSSDWDDLEFCVLKFVLISLFLLLVWMVLIIWNLLNFFFPLLPRIWLIYIKCWPCAWKESMFFIMWKFLYLII